MNKSLTPFILFLSLYIFTTSINAQQTNIFNLPATVPVPAWVKQIDWNKPNVRTIDAAINTFKLNEGKEGKEQAESNERIKQHEENEEPYLVAYIRWRNQISPFIQANGDVVIQPNYDKDKLQQALQQQYSSSSAKNAGSKAITPANWQVLGPIETFDQLGGKEACQQTNVYLLAIAPSNPATVYIASETGILFKTIDKGLHWTSVSDAMPPLNVSALVVDPANKDIVYCFANYTLLKTTNGGDTWTALNSFTETAAEKIVIHPTNGRILITGKQTILYSDNGGSTWNTATGSNINGYYYDIELNPIGHDTVYAVGADNAKKIVMLRSTNGGKNFSIITSGLSGIENTGARIAVSAANSNIVYCVALGNTLPPKVLKSNNKGANWTVIASSNTGGLTGGSGTVGLEMSNGQGFYDLDIMASPNNANQVIVGTTTIYKSYDGGINFAPIGGYAGSFNMHPDVQCMRVLGNDSYISSDGGVNYSTDFFTAPVNCKVRNHGITGANFWGFGQGWDEDIVASGTYHNGDMAVYEGYGKGNAIRLGGGEDATGHVLIGQPRTVAFRDIGTYTIPKTLNGAITTANISNTVWPQDDYYGAFASKLVIDPRYSNVYYVGKDSILWKSSNSGSSYSALHNFGKDNKVWRFDIARSNYDVMYLCANNGVYKTTDGGNNWTLLSIPYSSYNYYNTDIVINPLDEKEVIVCFANNAADEKVFKSTDGGSNWTNITGNALNGAYVSYLQYQGGTNGGIYAITSTNEIAKIFYRDNTMSDWTNFSTNLPNNISAREGGLIFYRDSKIRIAGNRGVWESDLAEKGTPVAQPMADKKYINCNKDTVQFFDYSMVDYAGATWQWTFPGATWVSSTTIKNPKVVYGTLGNYDVTLKVTNGAGQSHTRTENNMIKFLSYNCSADTVAGTCLNMSGNNDVVNLGKVNIHSNSFTISCWVKPKGLQNSFSQIIGHDYYPGSGDYGFGLGFTFSGYNPNLVLCYTDSTVNYGNYSSLVCDTNKWNYVVLSYSPTKVTMYLNGIPSVVNNKPMPIIDLSQSAFYANFDAVRGQGSAYKGLIDEIKFYNYALSQNEVREKMHIIQQNAPAEVGLLKYVQFNNFDTISETAYDVISGYRINVPITKLAKSTAPISTGTVYRKPLVNSSGIHSFPAANINLYLPPGGKYPNGEVVAFHLLSDPDENPDTRKIIPGYFIINNYGVNSTISSPDSINFSGLNLNNSTYTAGNFKLFKRNSTAYGSTWGNQRDSALTINYKINGSSLTWADDALTNFGQFVIINNKELKPTLRVNTPPKEESIVSDIYPNPTNNWTKIDICTITPKPIGISVIDMKGSLVYSITDETKMGKNTILLNLQHLAKGQYIVNIRVQSENPINKRLTIE